MKKSLVFSLLLSFVCFLISSPMFWELMSYLHPIVIVVLFFCIFVIALFFVLLIRKETIKLPFQLFSLLLILYTIGLLILLFLRPNNQDYNTMNLIPFSTISFYLSGEVNWLISLYNLAANIGLFILYGIFLRVINYSPFTLLVLPVLVISFIEVLQFLTHRGLLDIDDLILNLLGVFFGYLFYPIFKRIVKMSF
ncbi:MAG: VanZ family protein [Bacillus sp. (in: Bacteria)]|nr:VanZ family protein [Bacillus sp. (in: firmicutes)]